jgi:hypothetical protein
MWGPVPDGVLALSWVPFALAGHVAEGGDRSLTALFAWVMFISFVHQPLTFPLVYASPWRLATHKRLFLWFPIGAVVVIALATHVSLTAVAVIGALWNTEHILMQRYGIVRIYGRKAKDDQGGLERWMLVAWFLVPLLWVAASGRLQGVLDRLSTGSVDAEAARLLARMTGEARVALAVASLAAVYLTGRWIRDVRRAHGKPNPGKWLYLGSTAGMFALAVVDPVAAVIGFVASHSVEYFTLVGRSVGAENRHPGALGRVARCRHGRLLFFAGYAILATLAFVLLYRVAPGSVLVLAVLTIGAVHFFYDAFIWKLRKPEVAASLAAGPTTAGLAAIRQPA